jgi:hypothetical protein
MDWQTWPRVSYLPVCLLHVLALSNFLLTKSSPDIGRGKLLARCNLQPAWLWTFASSGDGQGSSSTKGEHLEWNGAGEEATGSGGSRSASTVGGAATPRGSWTGLPDLSPRVSSPLSPSSPGRASS